MQLLSVEVRNLRALTHASLEPARNGVTAILGSNGSGKSTIASTAIVWTLFGVSPDGVPVKGLRRNGTEMQRTEANVVFEHNGEVVSVSRAMLGKAGRAEAFVMIDDTMIVSGADATTAWMRSHLGMDIDAFLTAVVVRQDELDSIVKAVPSERRKTMQRLAGITRLAAAVKMAREDSAEIARTLSFMGGDSDAVAIAAESMEEARNDLARLQSEQNELSAALEQAQSKAQEAVKLQSDILSQHKLSVMLDNAAREAESELQRQENSLAQINESIAKLAIAMKESGDTQKAEQNITAANRDLEEMQAGLLRAQALKGRVQTTKKLVHDIEQERAAIDAQLARAQQEQQKLHIDQYNIEALNTEVQLQEANLLEAERDSARCFAELDLAKAALGATAQNNACPTCGQDIASIEEFNAHLNDKLQLAQIAADATIPAKASANNQLLAAKKNLRDAQSALQRAELATQAITNLIQQMDAIKVRHEQATQELESVMSDARCVVIASDDEIAEAKEAVRQSFALLEAIKNANAALVTHAQNVEARIALEAQVQLARAARDAARDAAQSAHVSPDMLNASNTAVTEANARQVVALEAERTARQATSIAEYHLKQVEEHHLAAQEQAAARQQVVARHADAELVAAELEAFRIERLARLGPELAVKASVLVAQMTDGAFVEVELDVDFTPFARRNDGTLLPAAWLSMGERAIVALALRLAVSESQFLVLDEVMRDLDAQWRASVLAALRRLGTTRQMLVMNHATEAADIADAIIDMDEIRKQQPLSIDD